MCNCSYTSHGHCGTLIDGDVDNDLTIETLCRQGVILAESGVDIIAPSDMMDGRTERSEKNWIKMDFTKFQFFPTQ